MNQAPSSPKATSSTVGAKGSTANEDASQLRTPPIAQGSPAALVVPQLASPPPPHQGCVPGAAAVIHSTSQATARALYDEWVSGFHAAFPPHLSPRPTCLAALLANFETGATDEVPLFFTGFVGAFFPYIDARGLFVPQTILLHLRVNFPDIACKLRTFMFCAPLSQQRRRASLTSRRSLAPTAQICSRHSLPRWTVRAPWGSQRRKRLTATTREKLRHMFSIRTAGASIPANVWKLFPTLPWAHP
jgi:hypothetical protein